MSVYLIDGITKKSISAMIGTIIGVIIAGICAAGFGYVAKISGYNVSEVEELVFVANNTAVSYTHLDVYKRQMPNKVCLELGDVLIMDLWKVFGEY